MVSISESQAELEQRALCERVGSRFVSAPSLLALGISLNVREGAIPINGLRHIPEFSTTGWYIWGGEVLSTDDDFFASICVEHIADWSPTVIKYLGLAPGWRFLVAGDYEDVWFDEKLLDI